MFRRTFHIAAVGFSLLAPVALAAQDAPAAPAAAEAAPAALTATAFIQQMADRIIGVINARPQSDDERAARREALRAAVREFIHLPTLAERTLGTHWETRTEEQRAEFVALLTELVETSYLRGLRDDGVNRDAATVVFTGEREARGRFTVEASVTFDGRSYVVEAKLMPRDGGFIVYDVITDDVSLEESYGESFDRIITEHGWDELLRRMRERITEMGSR